VKCEKKKCKREAAVYKLRFVDFVRDVDVGHPPVALCEKHLKEAKGLPTDDFAAVKKWLEAD